MVGSATAPVGLPRNVKWILVGPPCCSPATMQENVYFVWDRGPMAELLPAGK
jgi:hypothetical protein